MKNIFLILLLANILYLMWRMFMEDESQPGVAFVEESDLGPPLDVTTSRDSDDADSAVLQYLNEGMKVLLRATRGQIFVGHWVQIRGIADDAAAK
jgi:hypothetical protein